MNSSVFKEMKILKQASDEQIRFETVKAMMKPDCGSYPHAAMRSPPPFYPRLLPNLPPSLSLLCSLFMFPRRAAPRGPTAIR